VFIIHPGTRGVGLLSHQAALESGGTRATEQSAFSFATTGKVVGSVPLMELRKTSHESK
jgi:hypothetical protein